MAKKKSLNSDQAVDNKNGESQVDSFCWKNFAEDSDKNSEEESEEESEVVQKILSHGQKRTVENEDEEEVKKKKFKRDKDLFKQPTAEEMNQLRETETLFHSNLFRLQIEEVLNTTRVKDKYKKLFETWFEKFKKNIWSIEDSEEISLTSKKISSPREIKAPMPQVPVNKKGNFKYTKPSNITVIGSYSLGCTTGPDITVDVMVEMPEKFFHRLDYQNYRYMKKKALYLSWITAHMDENLAESKEFVGSSLMPILSVIPNGKLGKRVKVHVHLVAEDGSFKLNRFLPEKNSVRPEWYFGKDETSEVESLVPTPHYNSIILRDLTMAQVNARSAKIVREYPNIRDGIILLKIWLRQRQLNGSHESLSNHIITMYVLHLLFEKKLNTFMSSYQIVRNVWINLAMTDWSKEGLTMYRENETEIRVVDYQKYYECVFIDTSGYHNLAAHLSADTYHWVRSEADRAVKCLDDPNLDSFQALFMRPVPFYRAFDNLICVNEVNIIGNIVDNHSSPNEKLDFGPEKRAQAIKMISQVLKDGLGKRVSNIYVRPEKEKKWTIKEKPPGGIDRILIGLSLDPDYCFGIIDKGPHANLKEADDFRKFWGGKSELRRFQDGSICEALVWVKRAKTLSIKRTICKKIVSYLLKEKFGLSKNEYEYIADETDEFLQLKKIRGNFPYGTGEEATLQVLRAFGALEKELTSLTDLPLSISGIQGSSPVFRYTEVFPPLADIQESSDSCLITQPTVAYALINKDSMKIAPRHVPQIDVSVQLAMSGKWPDELEAVRKTKAAFHTQIARCLRQQCGSCAHANSQYVDVFKEGFVFRLEVAHQKEIALLKREVSEDRVEIYRDNEESTELEKKLFHLPKLSNALHGLHSQQPSFGPTCCLAKRWLSAHLLDESHIPDIVVELLVASLYLSQNPYKSPQTPQVGFLRFLEFFARRNWNTDPIFANFNDEMTREEIVAVENSFRTRGDSLPPIFISTPYDHTNSIWTRKVPTKLILNRIGSLAENSLKLVDEQIDVGTKLSFKPLFKAPMSGYDCLIRLHSSLNSRRYQFHDLNEKYPIANLNQPDLRKKIPVVNFDPVQSYLQELRRAYDEIALFFHDTYGGSIIGVLLKPASLETKEFKVSNFHCRKLNNEGKLVLDVPAMIENFSILGKGLVKSIDIQSSKIAVN